MYDCFRPKRFSRYNCFLPEVIRVSLHLHLHRSAKPTEVDYFQSQNFPKTVQLINLRDGPQNTDKLPKKFQEKQAITWSRPIRRTVCVCMF
jgi:ssDNA-specific exonuclease RecJ